MLATAAVKAAALYVALHTLLLIVLAAGVVRMRQSSKVGLGDGGKSDLLKAMRMHGNAAEQAAPTFAILILLALSGAPIWAVHAFGVATLVARVLHAGGLSKTSGSSFGRVAGMIITWTSMGVAAIGLVVLALT